MIEIHEIEEVEGVLEDVEKAKPSKEEEKYVESKTFLEDEYKAYLAMDRQFLTFLKVYIDKYEDGQTERGKSKKAFLICSFILLFISVLAPIVFCFFLLFRPVPVVSAVAAVVGLLVEIVSAIIILPRTIADYLFDKNENAQVVKIIENMQTYNTEKHSYLPSHNKTT